MAINRSVIVAFGISLLFSGCSGVGGGGQNTAPNPTSTPTAAPTTSPTVAPTAVPTPTPAVTPTAIPTVTPVPTGPVSAIVSSSTNVHSYTILLQQNASATLTQNGYTGTATIPATDSARYFEDLNAYSPLADVATLPTCAKSASYGTRTMLTYAGSTSGDVSCPPSTTAPAGILYDDEQAVEADLKQNLGQFNH
jgi:hypothetical protein